MTRKIFVPANSYFNNPEKYEGFEEMFGKMVVPVDLNGRVVPVDKNSKENLKNAQEIIRAKLNPED